MQFTSLDFLNGELRSLYRSPNIIRVNKSKRITGAGHVARMEEDTSALKTLTGNLKEVNLLEGLRVDGRTILNEILKK